MLRYRFLFVTLARRRLPNWDAGSTALRGNIGLPIDLIFKRWQPVVVFFGEWINVALLFWFMTGGGPDFLV